MLMRFCKLSFSALILASATLGLATGSVSVTAIGGYVAAKDTTHGSGGSWTGLSGSAGTATIQSGNAPTQLKFSTGASGLQAKSFDPMVTTNGNSTTTTTGQSKISNPGSSGAPTYYSAQWTSTTSSNTGANLTAGTGTYDPWTVTYGDIQKSGQYTSFGTTSFYYQSSLVDGLFSGLGEGQTASYNFDLSLTDENRNKLQFVDLDVYNDGNIHLDFATHADAGFKVYLLDETAAYPIAAKQTIETRLSRGTLLDDATGASKIYDYLATYLNEKDGSLDAPLTFGVVYDAPKPLPDAGAPGFDPNKSVVDWHSDTAQAAPEPSSVAALGLGALALLRRRKRA